MSFSELLNMPLYDSAGDGVSIGIADTLLKLPDKNKYSNDYKYKDLSIHGDGQQKTWAHGEHVYDILSTIAPGADFHFYRIKTAQEYLDEQIGDEGDVGNKNEHNKGDKLIRDSIGQAVDDEIDILNLSVGTFHRWCSGCVFTPQVEKFTQTGGRIVAAIGNEGKCNYDHVLCPALHDDVISVGGIENRCQNQLAQGQTDYRIWADTSNIEDLQIPFQGPFCSFRDCSPGYKCRDHRKEKIFDKNIRSFRGNPETLAPAYSPIKIGKDSNKAAFVTGTSFAAPIVSGIVARLKTEVSPTPKLEVIHQAIKNTGKVLSDEDEMLSRIDESMAKRHIQKNLKNNE